MPFAQNIVPDRRSRIHFRARGHGRRVRPGRVPMEFAPPSSRRNRAESDTAANARRHALAKSIAVISCQWGCRSGDGYPSGDGLGAS